MVVEESTVEIRETVTIHTPPEVVFKALTDEKELVQWMPQAVRMDARVGGEYEFKYHWSDRGLDTAVRGKILEFEPNRRLSYTWDAESADRTPRISGAIVTWTLKPLADGKTEVTLVHSGVGKVFLKDSESGWHYFLGRLVNYCKR